MPPGRGKIVAKRILLNPRTTVKPPSRFFYGWVIILLGLFIFFLAYGFRYSFSVIFPSLLQQFQWPRGATAAILSFHLLAYGITAPIAGAMVDRLGVRKTMGLGTLLMALGVAASALGSSLWHFYLSFGLLMGAGLCLMGSVPLTRVVANWFVAKRGLALSFMFIGGGGSHLLYPFIAVLIATVGWRGTFVVEGALVAVLLFPAIVLLIRHRPEEMGLLPDGSNELTEAKANPNSREMVVDKEWAATDWTLPKAMKSYRFWALCFTAFAIWGIGQHILVAHHIAFAEDMGYSKLYASSVLALFGVFMSVGALAAFISDRIGREATLSLGVVIAALGVTALMLIRDTTQPWLLYTYAILFGLGFGMSMPTIPAAATDMLQGRRAGAAIGFVWFAFAMGGAVGPWLGGVVFEIGGSYLPAFIVAAAMLLAGGVSMWIAAPRRVRLVAGRARALRKTNPALEKR